jgi:hypothetical protein
VAGIRQILKDTAGLKAALGMEAQITTNLDGPVAHRNLMQDVGDPRVKVNLDPTNMVHLMNQVRMSRLKWARSLLPEHFPSEQLPEAYAYIRKVAAKVGVKIYGG